ncbi:hypothetical protein G9A89_010962 [Geosiphon pyriformis]|nr:hypothetical protein G9A89_010962 [Geosiphon pyriformis]
MASVDKIERELEYAKTQYDKCEEKLKEKEEKLKEKEEKLKKLMEGEKEDELREKEDELREKEDELRELKKNLRQEKYKKENEKHWWIEDMQELEMQKEKLEKQIEKQKEKLEEEVKELKVEKNELKVDMNELKTSKDRWELQMQKLQNTLMETTKTDALHTGYIEPGYRGELVARLLLMIAWDHATRDRDISPHLGNLGYSKEFVSRPIRVKEFLISLFGQENYDEHIQSFPQKLANGLLAFTHFIPVTYTPNQTQLRTLFIRFAAVICKRNQAGVDLIIPVLLDWDGSSPISVDSMSYFLIQVKNWSKVYDAHWPSSATSKLSREFVYKGKTTEENQNPYLSLYLQLGAPEPALDSFYIESFPAFNTKLQKKARLEAEKAGKAKAQYCLSGLGLDKILYRCLDKLSDDDISILKQLLCAWPDPLKLAKHENVKSLLRSMMPLVYEK